MRKQSLIVLFGLLAVAAIIGCSQSGDNTFENPVAGINATAPPVSSNAPAGKVTICHFIQPDEVDDCGTGTGSVVIRVSGNAFDGIGANDHTSHGDFFSGAPVGTCNCDD